MTAHQATVAFPIGSAVDKQQARKLTTLRMAYVLSAGSEAPSLVATDPVTGDIPQAMTVLGRMYYFDAADVSSVHDGTTVLVTSDGKRYKLASNSDLVKLAVTNVTTTSPPGSPSIGDAYYIAAGATGTWSGHSGSVGVFTARGWEYITLQVGQVIYDRSIDGYWHINGSSTLTAGLGTNSLLANSVLLSNLLGKPVRVLVENQTTNSPPGSPSLGDAYVIGSSPTGAWAGSAGKLAILESTASPITFTIYTQADGWTVYDKSLKADYRYSSSASAWVSAEGAIAQAASSGIKTNPATSSGGSGSYSYSATTAPTKTPAFVQDDDACITSFSARKTAARLEFDYSWHAGSTLAVVVALFRDAETTALDWKDITTLSANGYASVTFEISANDASAHTYKAVLINQGAGNPNGSITRRRMSVREFI